MSRAIPRLHPIRDEPPDRMAFSAAARRSGARPPPRVRGSSRLPRSGLTSIPTISSPKAAWCGPRAAPTTAAAMAARGSASPISSPAAISTSSSIPRRRSKIRRPIAWSASPCPAPTCRPNARVLSLTCRISACPEWSMRAAGTLRAQWSEWSGLPAQNKLVATLRAKTDLTDEMLVSRGGGQACNYGALSRSASYYWPMQSHGSIGPSCAVADVDKEAATVWTASQGTHGNRKTFARFLRLPEDQVRLIYLEGAGCYGMNGHEDAAADAAILSQAIGRPVRVQWSRQDEHGWDPKGPPQLLDISGVVDSTGRIREWRTEMWLPQTTKGLSDIPLLGPAAAGLDDVRGLQPGAISQNTDPPYAADKVEVLAHWLKDAPLRPAPIRSPGKPANCFAVESFTDELASAAGLDPIEFRLRGLDDKRGVEAIKRAAALMNWQSRPSPGSGKNAGNGAAVMRGRGFAYVHYKHSESYVAMGIDVAVERASGR